MSTSCAECLDKPSEAHQELSLHPDVQSLLEDTKRLVCEVEGFSLDTVTDDDFVLFLIQTANFQIRSKAGEMKESIPDELASEQTEIETNDAYYHVY